MQRAPRPAGPSPWAAGANSRAAALRNARFRTFLIPCYNQDMYLAIDIGGTKTLIALFSRHGRVLKKTKFKTAQGYKKFTADLIHNLGPYKKRKIRTIVVAVPGVVQKNYSAVLGNRDWGKIDLLSHIKSVFSCPIYFENDANLASIFESKGLKGKTIFLTFSTGIGGGIAENGKILPESAKFEPGHTIYEYKGKKKEWEDIAASSALESTYHVDYATDIRGKAAHQDIAARVALGLSDIVDKYHPDTIVLGGPLGKVFRLYSKYLPKLGVRYRRPKRPLESVIYGCYIFGKSKK